MQKHHIRPVYITTTKRVGSSGMIIGTIDMSVQKSSCDHWDKPPALGDLTWRPSLPLQCGSPVWAFFQPTKATVAAEGPILHLVEQTLDPLDEALIEGRSMELLPQHLTPGW